MEGRLYTGGLKTPRGRRPLEHLMADQGIEGRPGGIHIIGKTTELKPILKNKNTSLIERIDPVSEDKNES